MPSNNEYDSFSQYEDSMPNGTGTMTTNPPWPLFSRIQQTQIETKFFEQGATIHYERLPPFPSWSRLAFLGENFFPFYVTSKVVQVAQVSRRRLTADEVDGTSEAAATSARYFAWTQPISWTIAASSAWGTRKTFKFPFYQPKKTFDPFKFPGKRLPLLNGIYALSAWHITRVACYIIPFWVVGLLLSNSLAQSTFEVRLMRDPRLKNLVQDVKKSAKIQLQGLPRGLDQETFQSPQDQYPSEPESQVSQGYERDTHGEQPAPAPQSSWSRYRQSQAPPSKPKDTSPPKQGSRNIDEASSLFDDDDDDASPVSASVRRAEAQRARDAQNSSSGSSGSSGSGGSAWDRIRQQSKPGDAQWAEGDSSGQEQGWARLRQDKTQNPREVQPKSNDFAYSKYDEDREKKHYEKDQAQKEFDALVEAERRGDTNRR